MALINTVSREKADGVVKEGYDRFMEYIGIIPKPMEMLSASPGFFAQQLKRIEYYSTHPTLSFPLLTHIRYLMSHKLKYPFCADFNKHMLKKQGVEEADFRKMEEDPSKAMLEENETAMLQFVMKAVDNPGSITEADIQSLKAHGWEDGDMVDALAHGVSMIDHSIMMQVFQMDQSCMAD